jgi:hypothetical protein
MERYLSAAILRLQMEPKNLGLSGSIPTARLTRRSTQPGVGPNAIVYEIKVLGDGKIIIGGGFSNYNGTAIQGLAV